MKNLGVNFYMNGLKSVIFQISAKIYYVNSSMKKVNRMDNDDRFEVKEETYVVVATTNALTMIRTMN